MTMLSNNDKQPASQSLVKPGSSGNQKKKKFPLPVTAGTILFLSACLLLIAGLCKFSFYVLNNHRTLATRDDFVKTYVDVQPYSAKHNNLTPSYIALNNPAKGTPAVFYAPETAEKVKEEHKSTSAETEKVPAPVYTGRIFAKPEPVQRLAPLPERPILTAAVQSVSFPSAPKAVSLDDLMASGTTLLDEADASIISTESHFMADEPAQNTPAVLPPPAEQQNAVQKTAAAEFPLPALQDEPALEKTHWVNIAALRRTIEETTVTEKVSAPKKTKEQIEKENASLLDMNETRQVAELKTGTSSDTLLPEKEKNPVVQDIPFSGTEPVTAEVKTPAASGDKPIIAKTDIPPVPTEKANIESEDYTNPWKIATVNGMPKNRLAVVLPDAEKKTDVLSKNPQETEEYMEISSENVSVSPGQAVIYRNGKVHKVYQLNENADKNTPPDAKEKKTLNWMERQQAAVWTSMSQSDVPSVWTISSDPEGNPESAKAFKVADTGENKPETGNTITSAQVRTVGEEKKPEGKKDPLLLPLGPAPATLPVIPQTAPTMLPSPLQATSQDLKITSNPTEASFAAPVAASADETAEIKSSAAEEDGLVNKIFSLFGKPETAGNPEMPSLGASTPASSTPDLNKGSKEKKDLKSGKKISKEKNVPETKETEKTVSKKTDADNILPAELRLTFKPDSAEISTQSVKWIKAFGQRAKKDIQRAVEVRMSSQNPQIQDKRFALIRSALLGSGMEDTQIIPVMTNRTPHTIVLRLFDMPEEGYEEYTSSGNGIEERLYYRQW